MPSRPSGVNEDYAAKLARVDDDSPFSQHTTIAGPAPIAVPLDDRTAYILLNWYAGTASVFISTGTAVPLDLTNGFALAMGQPLFLDVKGGTQLNIIGASAGSIVSLMQVFG